MSDPVLPEPLLPEPVSIDARGMKCPWPALRAARAMRSADMVTIRADDGMAERELQALAAQQGWHFAIVDTAEYRLARVI